MTAQGQGNLIPFKGRAGEWLLGERKYHLGLAALIVIFIALMTAAQFVKYNTFGMGFDLGVYEQVIWNTSQGRWFATSNFKYTNVHPGADVILMEALIAIPYALFPTTYTLMFLETLAVGLGVIPFYLLARSKLGSPPALVLSAAFLSYVPLHFLNLYEFQPRAFAIGLVFALFYFLETGRWRAFLASALLILTTRSDIALLLAMFGLYAALRGKPRRFAVAPLVLGVVWFVVAFFVIVPHFNTGGQFQYLSWYGYLGHNPGEILLTVITRPLFVLQNVVTVPKIESMVQVYGELGFLPLLHPDVFIVALPTLALGLLSQQSIQWDIRHQYISMLYPLAFVGTVMAIEMLMRRTRLMAPQRLMWSLVTIVLVGTLASQFIIGSPVWSLLKRAALLDPSAAAAQALIRQIPPEAPVAASNLLGAHLARRQGFYFFPPVNEFYTDQALNKADYILVDLKTDEGDPTYASLKADPNWSLIAQQDRYRLFKRNSAF